MEIRRERSLKLIVENVCKKIKNKIILDNINFTLESGKIYGFVGENGSGKTMLFRAVSGLMKIDSGEIYLDDKLLHKDFEILPNLGIMLENAGLYPELSGYDNLKNLMKLRGKVDKERIVECIKSVGLDPYDKRPIRKYSLGMKQRIVFAQAIMENPKILMIDEPTNALDAEGIDIVRNLILERKKDDAIVMIASHNKEDIEILADVVYQVEKGQVTFKCGE